MKASPHQLLKERVRQLEREIAALRAGLKALGGKPARPRRCGVGNRVPVCMGSAARGPDYCTCVR